MQFEALTGRHVYTFDEHNIRIELSKMREHKDGDLSCEMLVTTNADDHYPHLLIQSVNNLLSARVRKDIGKELSERYQHKVPWGEILEGVCVRSVEALRVGEPAEELWADPTDDSISNSHPMLVEPLLYLNKPNLLYGDGGVGKSQIATAVGLHLQEALGEHYLGFRIARQVNVGYLDWEADRDDMQISMKKIAAGFGLGAVHLFYRRCALPLVDDFSSIERIIADHNIGFVIIDSISLAVGEADMYGAQAATSLFSALRRLNVTALLIHHISKGNGDGKSSPYGSVYFRNLVRNAWEIRAQDVTDDAVVVALYHNKCNLGRRQAPIGFRIAFDDKATYIERTDIMDVPELCAALPLKAQIVSLLQHGKMGTADIAQELGASEATVRVTLNRYKNQFTRQGNEWGLLFLNTNQRSVTP